MMSMPKSIETSNSSDPTESADLKLASQADGPSRGSLLVIFLTVFIDLLGFGMVLPLLPAYAEFFVTDAVGLKLGILMAIFSIMQFFFAPIWGSLSDRIGRRPVLMIGLLGSVIFYSLFGIATLWQSYWMLFFTRLGAGIFGATISTAQAYIADTTSKENRSRGMALIGMAFGMGFTFGPVIGYFALPSGEGDPGSMPGFLAAGLSLVALLIAYFVLPESLKTDSESANQRRFDMASLRQVAVNRAVVLVLITIFLCVFSFAMFETTLSILIKQSFEFSFREICLTFAFIGFTLAFIQGGLVRPLSKRISESILATSGAALEVVGFVIVIYASYYQDLNLFFTAMIVIVTGFSFLQPSLNSLLSRRADPMKQGLVLGVGQSVNALARIFGSLFGLPLLTIGVAAPFSISAGLMLFGAIFIWMAVRAGGDFQGNEFKSADVE
ncbi:MFS transporter [Mariniblastus sp.]|jgi:MFS transporter, DHA1 family, tetracycline resistance protein|nr:MFS transporter [Mariniblastus sp.]